MPTANFSLLSYFFIFETIELKMLDSSGVDRSCSSRSFKSKSTMKSDFRRRDEKMMYMKTPPTLSWRLCPQESLSDWTLKVISSETINVEKQLYQRYSEGNLKSTKMTNIPLDVSRSIKKYHVHRTQLAVGPRKSEFFSTLFKKRKCDSESRDNIDIVQEHNETVIELLPSAAAAFPVLLDFMYAQSGANPVIQTESSVALRHLASCFGIRELFNCATSFIKNDLTPQTAPAYLLESKAYKHKKLESAAVEICSKNLKDIKLSLLVILPSNEMARVINSTYTSMNSTTLSSKVASYCRCRHTDMTLSILKDITNAKKMHTIAKEDSLFYIQLLQNLGAELPDVSLDSAEGKTLYERCVIAAPHLICLTLGRGLESQEVTNQITLNESSTLAKATRRLQKESKKYYDNFPEKVKVEILEKTVGSCFEKSIFGQI